MKEITVEELKSKIENAEPFIFLDVREPFEAHISKLNIPTVSIPLDELPSRVHELNDSETIIVMCRSGNRSGTACELLEEKRFEKVFNLKGGINDWAKKIDPSLPQY
ncbi:MAG: rhodanese-like domain-containing protein [Balneolaceae bacterium]|nr:MAG: rhodanese-like domain-containing protein [Balneolaceae bacterium]